MIEKPIETTLYSMSDSVPPPSERRTDERHLTLFRVGTVQFGERRELCLIKNISAGGMMIRAYCTLKVGDRLSIELKCGETVDGAVSWIEGDCAGIAFDQAVDVVDLLTAASDGPKPRMPRVEIRCIASVRQDASIYGIMARDISQGGVKLETNRDLEIGSDVVVTLPGLSSLPGSVRWRDSSSYGVTFNRLLSLSELVGWLQSQRESLRAAS